MRNFVVVPLTLLSLLVAASKAGAAGTSLSSLDLSSPPACYQSMQTRWNSTQDPPTRSIALTEKLYRGFATCAIVAVKAHDGDDYFANTIGAMYAQSWLGVLYKRKNDNGTAHQHFALARDLNKLARQIIALHDPMGNVTGALLKFDKKYGDLDSGRLSAWETI